MNKYFELVLRDFLFGFGDFLQRRIEILRKPSRKICL